jgi:probable F420-dependent oxidoreductase
MRDDRFRVGFVEGDLARAVALEALPIDSLWVGGHVSSPNPTRDAIVGLAQLATLTARVQVGTSILLLPLYPPAIIAKQIADLDRATGGRVVLGVGVGGEYPQEFRACQVPRSERGPRTDEAIPLLRRLWTAEELTHEGRYYSMTDVRIHPAPAQPGGPPIVVAGRREPAMRRAARLGDGWMPYLYSPRRYAASVATIRDAATETGRDLVDFQWFAFVFVNANPDGDLARRQATEALGSTYQQDFGAFVDRVAAAGTPAEVADKLKAFVDAGARHLILGRAASAREHDAIVQRLFDEVIPSVRAHAGATGA